MKNCKTTENYKTLRDLNKNGKDRRWRERKLDNIELGKNLEKLGYRAFKRVLECSETLVFKETEDKGLKLHQAYFCKNKLCPICNWRRSMKYSSQITEMVDVAIKQNPKAQFLFLTLTAKNCDGCELYDELSKYSQAFNRLVKYKKVSKNLLGFVRATEVTYNSKTKTYHPHLHVLLMVKNSYFIGDVDNYIKQEEWIKLWKKAMKLDYDPSVNIKKVKAKKHTDIRKAVQETAKYPTKPLKVMTDSEEELLQVTDDLFCGLYKKRQLGFGGIFKDIRKQLQLDDIENGDLVVTDDEDKECSTGVEIVAQWCWRRSNYFII